MGQNQQNQLIEVTKTRMINKNESEILKGTGQYSNVYYIHRKSMDYAKTGRLQRRSRPMKSVSLSFSSSLVTALFCLLVIGWSVVRLMG